MELDAIIKEIGLEKLVNEFNKTSPFSDKKTTDNWEDAYKELEKKYVSLKEDNQKLKSLATQVLADFDRVNTMLRDSKAGDDFKQKFEDSEVARKEWYNKATESQKQNMAYSKAISAINGALEVLIKELK